MTGGHVNNIFFIILSAKPRISNITFPTNLHEGMRTAVTCIVLSGDPPITMRWLKDGTPLSEEDLDASVFFGGNGFVSTLTINTLAYKHNGNYTCTASNDVGTETVSSRLIVKGKCHYTKSVICGMRFFFEKSENNVRYYLKYISNETTGFALFIHTMLFSLTVRPRWILEPRDTSAVAGRAARLDCQADGVPQPHVRWKMSTSKAFFKSLKSIPKNLYKYLYSHSFECKIIFFANK